jgi:hypothetical protein
LRQMRSMAAQQVFGLARGRLLGGQDVLLRAMQAPRPHRTARRNGARREAVGAQEGIQAQGSPQRRQRQARRQGGHTTAVCQRPALSSARAAHQGVHSYTHTYACTCCGTKSSYRTSTTGRRCIQRTRRPQGNISFPSSLCSSPANANIDHQKPAAVTSRREASP